MTDTQFGALITTILAIGGGIAGTIRWAVGRITKALDDNTASNAKLADAQIEHAGRMAAMATKLDHVSRWVHDHTPVEMPVVEPLEDEVRTDRTDRTRRRSARTRPEGVAISGPGYRPPTRGGHDD